LTVVAVGGELVHTLVQHELIDEYRPMVHPVVLGGGTRLFREGGDKTVLKRVETSSFSSGIVVLFYHQQVREEKNNMRKGMVSMMVTLDGTICEPNGAMHVLPKTSNIIRMRWNGGNRR
jgi:hypothetical protein